ncbi:hypothetical protein Ruko_21190 [Ruthenibacterium sp. TH_2024_36131]|uniref:HNH endonuclease n=1 Tax=Owariibacterium komagatae TaxID=3136601 RepID=UPI0038B3E38D
MSDLEMLAALNHVELSHVEEALRRDVRCMVLREVCEYMKRSPENSLRIRRLYHRHDNLRAAQIAAQGVCNCRLSEEDLAWLDCCIRAAFHKKPRRLPISEEERRFLWNKQAGKCAVCNRKVNVDDFHVDHIVPWDYVGDELENNKRVLCAACNRKKSNQAVTVVYDLFFGTRGEAI